MLQGGCSCGRVRYTATGTPFNSTLCHCVDCRRVSAAPATAWFTLQPGELRWSGPPPEERRSSPRATRSFCLNCGTQLTFRSDDFPDEVDVATCSLDEAARVPPEDQVWTEQRVAWLTLDPALRALPRGRVG